MPPLNSLLSSLLIRFLLLSLLYLPDALVVWLTLLMDRFNPTVVPERAYYTAVLNPSHLAAEKSSDFQIRLTRLFIYLSRRNQSIGATLSIKYTLAIRNCW